MPALGYDSEKFIFACNYEDRLLARDAGFSWNAEAKVWYTTSLAVAARLRSYAVGLARTKLNQVSIVKKPWTSPLPLPPAPYELLPHQREAISFALGQNRSYLGLDPGLGKTICAAVITAALHRPTVYITPPFLVNNVVEEFKRFAPSLKLRVFTSRYSLAYAAPNRYNFDVLIIPDSLLGRPELTVVIAAFTVDRGLLIVDEAHRFKNESAKRTKALFGTKKTKGVVDYFSRQVWMSGTPIINRPMELYPVLSKVAPETINFMGMFDYGRRYCAGHQNQFGWDFSGASNVKELAAKVIAPSGPFMLRQKKDKILNLPPKIEELFVLSEDLTPRLAKLDSSIFEKYSDVEDLIKDQLSKDAGIDGEVHIATYRRLLGVEKARASIDYIKALLAETDENILIFAFHKAAIAVLARELAKYDPVIITGDVAVKDRQNLVNKFQTSKASRLVIGNYVACGTGFTMVKASRVIFVEFSWSPADNIQASDRAHRIGQSRQVLVQYVVYAKSIDHAVVNSLLRKGRTLAHI